MISLNQRISQLNKLGDEIRTYFNKKETDAHWLAQPIREAHIKNGWFTRDEVHRSLKYWAEVLSTESLSNWISPYQLPVINKRPKTTAIIMAGNIPLVGFHDFVCVFLTGNIALVKCSSGDNVLIPALLRYLISLDSGAVSQIIIAGSQLKDFGLVIATGSNNSARYFEQYFGKVPHIIRRNRTSVAILKGNETEDEMLALMCDIFSFYGLGCRNVTKLYLPKGFDFNKIFKASLSFDYMLMNKKYVNNYTYYKALLMLERKPFLDNELILLVEDEKLYSPVSLINYQCYADNNELIHLIEDGLDSIQCVYGAQHRPYGSAQYPALDDYPDGVDTINFLVNNSI